MTWSMRSRATAGCSSGTASAARDDGWIELEVLAARHRAGPVLLVIAWPDVWHDESQLEPHLISRALGQLRG